MSLTKTPKSLRLIKTKGRQIAGIDVNGQRRDPQSRGCINRVRDQAVSDSLPAMNCADPHVLDFGCAVRQGRRKDESDKNASAKCDSPVLRVPSRQDSQAVE